MSYNLRRDDGSETQGESPEEAAALMRGLEDAESGRVVSMRRVRGELARILGDSMVRGLNRQLQREHDVFKKFIRMPTVWPRADPDEVAKTVKGAEDAIGD
ncbi:MAG: hypothetical protein IIC91_15415 [Chloroflexi bacterium]|nr:hypothetical protein [Chloroflexota bacterium]